MKNFDDIPLGLTARFSKTVSESDVYLFAGITGDFDPNHVDEEFALKAGFGGRLAHGALLVGYMSTASSAVLADFPLPMLSIGYDRVRFIKPVHFGDTLTVTYEIASKDDERRRTEAKIVVTNQRGDIVAVATHIMKVLPE